MGLARFESIITRAEQKIEKAESSTGNRNDDINAQIEKEQSNGKGLKTSSFGTNMTMLNLLKNPENPLEIKTFNIERGKKTKNLTSKNSSKIIYS